MESKMLKLGVVLGLLAMMVSSSMQLHVNHPMYDVVQRVNNRARPMGPSLLGLILTSPNDEKQLLASGYFDNEEFFYPPPITIAGRTYKFGAFNGIVTVYALAGEPLAAVSVTVQILLDNFNIGAVLSVGGGRSVAKNVALGDVSVLYSSAYTGAWYWEEWESPSVSKTPNATLRIGDYNYPEAGENKLASIKFQSVTRYTPTSSKKTTFWFNIPDAFQKLASQLTGVELEKCLGEAVCNEEAKVVVGGKAASSDIYLANHAYGNFLNHELGISIVDKQSAAVGSTAHANGVPFALFRAATNKAGETSNSNLIALATRNSYKVAATFVDLISDRLFNIKRHGIA